MSDAIGPEEAADALAAVGKQQEQVIDEVAVPLWYWWAIAGSMVGLGIAVDSQRPAFIAAVAVVFVVVVGGLTALVITGARRVQVRNDLLGPEGAGLIVLFVGVVVVASLAVAFILEAFGFRAPATVGTVVGAVGLVVGGPAVNRRLRQIMMRHRAVIV